MDLITYLYGDSKKTYNHEFIPYVFVFVFGYRMAIRIRSWRTLHVIANRHKSIPTPVQSPNAKPLVWKELPQFLSFKREGFILGGLYQVAVSSILHENETPD